MQQNSKRRGTTLFGVNILKLKKQLSYFVIKLKTTGNTFYDFGDKRFFSLLKWKHFFFIFDFSSNR